MSTVVAALAILLLASGPQGGPDPPVGRMVEKVACTADPEQTYTLYLPGGHTSTRRWPALLILDAGGRSTETAELFREAAGRWGWVLLSSDATRSEGGQSNLEAVNALWAEAHSRWNIDLDRVYAAGFSGTGHVAYLLGKQTGGLAGVIVSGSRPIDRLLEGTDFAMFTAAGDLDFNYRPMLEVDRFMAGQGNPHRFEMFEGRHRWMPAGLAAEAVAWMELVAMRRNLRPRDATTIDELYAHELAAAEALHNDGELLGALRRYQTIVRTFDGLRSTSRATAAVRRLEADPAVERAVEEDRTEAAYETSTNRRFRRVFEDLDARRTAIPPARLRRDLGVRRLQRHAEDDGARGVTARRLLATLHTHLAFYLTRRFLAADRWRHVESVLTVASEIDGGRPAVWYNLGCARARLGDGNGALEAIRRAVSLGFDDAEHLGSDPDLEAVRSSAEFEAILADLQSKRR